MRVQSSNPMKNGGWLHQFDSAPAIQRKLVPPRPTIDAEKLARDWHDQTPLSEFDRLGSLLGVSAASLLALRCGYAPEYRAWSFPMRNGAGDIVGIRLRTEGGQKFSVTGGHEGIFLPRISLQPEAWIVEGPTDCAALLTLGKFSIGRPSCSGGIAHLAATCARLKIRRCLIVADHDEDKIQPNGTRWNPGLDGAQRLAEEIGVPCGILILPMKDSREYVLSGGTSLMLDSLSSSIIYQQPNQQVRRTSTTSGTSVLYTLGLCQENKKPQPVVCGQRHTARTLFVPPRIMPDDPSSATGREQP